MSTIDTLTTDELKVRFQTRTIPLESDFAALIDVAECGRRAVGANPEQTPNPSSGLVMDTGGQLTVLPALEKGIIVDSSGVGVVVNAASGMQVDASGVGINTTSSNGLIAADNQLKVALSASNPGLELTTDGLRLKPNSSAGIVVDGTNGVGVNTGNGIICANNQINIKLAKGSYDNGGGGQGSNGAISGTSGGLYLTADGLSVDPGLGMQLNAQGVSIKCAVNGGLTASESNGVGITNYESLYIKMLCDLHRAQFYGVHPQVIVLASKSSSWTMVYFYSRGGGIAFKNDSTYVTIRGTQPSTFQLANSNGYNYNFPQIISATWANFTIANNDTMTVPILLADEFQRVMATLNLVAVNP